MPISDQPIPDEQVEPPTAGRTRVGLVLGILGLCSFQAVAALVLWFRYLVEEDPGYGLIAGYYEAFVLPWLLYALLGVIHLGAWVRSWRGRLLLAAATILPIVIAMIWPI